MRRKAGDSIRVVDGVGHAFEARILHIQRGRARCTITARLGRVNEPPQAVTIAAAVLKSGAAYDFLIEKCTELGVSAFVPLLTERTIPGNAKRHRWQKLALAAMKQCGRSVLPSVAELTPLGEFLRERSPSTLGLIPHETVRSPALADMKPTMSPRVAICIGPEGGFSDAEITLAVSAGWTPVSLGSRRLRAETAAIAAATLVLLHP
jgi:16S rRNA (uracil1498-N3)-methyltransferase